MLLYFSIQEAGIYECIAENEAGRDAIQMEVTVLGLFDFLLF